MMEQRISLITIGVRDLEGAAGFYEALGWKRVETDDGVVVFDLVGQSLGLYPVDRLADDMGLPVSELGSGAVTLGYNCRTRNEVSDLLDRARRAGAEILKPAQDVFWGGHHGYFRAPDGSVWEIAFNPYAPLGPDGAFRWNGHG